MNECSLPRKREVELGARIRIRQSATWSWPHQPAEEQQLSPRARQRLGWIRWWQEHGQNKSLACRHFAIGRPTFDRWLVRYQQRGLRGLEDRSRRPHRTQPPHWTTAQVLAVQRLREQYPYMGKAKLRVLLEREGTHLSVSTVGRILHRLRLSGQLAIPPRLQRRRGRSGRRPAASRKPKDYVVQQPGDLAQVDTVDVQVAPNTRVMQLSLVDTLSRWAAAEVRTGKTAATMRDHLEQMRARLPFELRAIQVDGGSEFMAEFETYCQQQGIRLFVLPPRSPKLNGMVERLQGTFRDELYACVDLEPRVAPIQAAVRAYEDTYNTIRPHQSLGYRTPQQFLTDWEAA
ncbi:MAG TPA: integrase core domain-containing protein [Chloroflexota bacterium]|nr:integrase core domain-containing protein [Chloroflexota bacterium]